MSFHLSFKCPAMKTLPEQKNEQYLNILLKADSECFSFLSKQKRTDHSSESDVLS